MSNDILYKPFNIQTHKETFINYLEVVIGEDGVIEYATPSHQEKLISVCCKKLNVTRDILNDMCPKEYYADFINWLCQVSGYISVWNDFSIGNANEKQKMVLKKLKNENLYNGKLYK